jgi:hypothetical protein
VIDRPDLRVTEQPGGLLDRHAVIRQVTRGKAAPELLKDFGDTGKVRKEEPILD